LYIIILHRVSEKCSNIDVGFYFGLVLFEVVHSISNPWGVLVLFRRCRNISAFYNRCSKQVLQEIRNRWNLRSLKEKD